MIDRETLFISGSISRNSSISASLLKEERVNEQGNAHAQHCLATVARTSVGDGIRADEATELTLPVAECESAAALAESDGAVAGRAAS